MDQKHKKEDQRNDERKNDNKLREAFIKNDADLEELDKMSEKMRRKRVMEDEIEAMLKEDDHIVHK